MTQPPQRLQSHPASLGSDQAETLLDTVLSRAPVGFAFVDRELRYVRVNAHFAAVISVPADAHLGRTVGEVVPEIATAVEPMLRQVLETGEPLLVSKRTGRSWAAQGTLASGRPASFRCTGRMPPSSASES
jgi:PAS domain-containing protein